MARPVYVVHCVDTEGPLHESVEATFERLKAIFGIDLEPSVALLRQLQAGEVDLGGLEQAVRKVVDPHLLGYNDTWDKVDGMLASCMSQAFREQTVDSDGHGWVYNWFCVDHVDYDLNPRRRDIGYHNIYDHYQGVLRETGSARDGVQFHYHPHNFRREANRCATHWWASSDSLVQVLCRRVIDRRWFPAAHRAGFHVIRPDSHWFLEQHIPFDLSSQAVAAVADDSAQSGLDDGRWGDWRRAPVTWEPYHPAHDDYQERGSCRRWIARCLNIGTRYRLLGEEHVRQAFAEAEADRPVVLAFTNHDFRDMRPDIDGVRELLTRVGREFPDVPFRFSEVLTAMREALQLPSVPACELEVTLSRTGPSTHVLEVRSEVPTFGPQPWLALRTVAGTYHHDNLDIDEPFHRWRYVFDEETYPLGALDAIGLAANNAYGVTTVVNVDPATGAASRRVLNDPSAAIAASHGS
jgi:hypothetical protein